MRTDNTFDTLAGTEYVQGIDDMSWEGSDGRDLGAMAHYGVSETLIGLFDSLRETPGQSGLKFRGEDIHRLARAVLFRSYGKACLELSYLLSAIITGYPSGRHRTPLLDFFWAAENITPGRFREAFKQGHNDKYIAVRLDRDFLTLSVENERFAISPTRVAYLAALLEFVVFIDPKILQNAEAELCKPRVKKIKAFSSKLQKIIYAFLADHLQPAQQQRRFRRLFSWCRNAKAEDQAIDSVITDDAVLAFWRESALDSDDSIGFRRFRTVGEDFIALKKALDVGRSMQQVAESAPIGLDAEAGEWHPDRLEAVIVEQGSDISSLDFLAREPKFLTAEQVNNAAPLMKAGEQGLHLPLTLARMAIFGDWQAKLSQAEKDRNRERLNTYLRSALQPDYGAYRESMHALFEVIEQARLLALGMLLEMEDPEAMALIAELLPEQALEKFGQLDDGPRLDQAVSAAEFFSGLSSWCLQLPELNHLCQAAATRFKKTNRAGFKQLPDKSDLSGYLHALDTLRDCKRLLGFFINSLDKRFQQTPLVDYAADVSIFRAVFTEMYGERP